MDKLISLMKIVLGSTAHSLICPPSRPARTINRCMTITPYEFFYDGQQRRFLEQIVRAFSGFSYQTGRQGGAPQTLLVPVNWP